MSEGHELPEVVREKPVARDTNASETALLLTYLWTHDAACPVCKYNLRGLTVPRYPECGNELRLTVGVKKPYLRTLVTMMVALCLPGGCGLLVWIIILTEVVRFGSLRGFPDYHDEPGAALLVLAVMFTVIPTGLSIALHKKFILLETKIQVTLVALAVMWDVVLLLVLLGLIFEVLH